MVSDAVTKKQLEMVKATLSDISNRQDLFLEALAEQRIDKLIQVFNDEQCAHLMILPDMVDDPEVKVILTDQVMACIASMKLANCC